MFSHSSIFCLLQVSLKTLLCHTTLEWAILLWVHSQLEELLIVRTSFPSVFFHLLAEVIQIIGIECLHITCKELQPLLLSQFLDFRCHLAWQLTALAENHAPNALVSKQTVARLALGLCHNIHQSDILDILTERGHQWRITYLRPYIFHFVKQLHYHFVNSHFRFALRLE